MKHRTSLLLALAAALLALVAAGCGGGSSDDASGAGGGDDDADVKLSLVAYAVPKVGFDKVIPAFQATPEGRGIGFSQSYGASGDQSRKVAAGLATDVVNFSVEPDVTRLVEAGLVDEDWNAGPHRGIPFGSVVTIVTRPGNPLGIRTWDDLLRDGVEVVTPNPFSSGSAKWNLLAPYAEKSRGGRDVEAGLDYIRQLVGDHIRVQPRSGREATETFLQGTGDVLLSYENEAIYIKEQGEDVEYVTPPTTFKIENPVAVVNRSDHPQEARAFVDYLFTPEAQRLWAEAGFRPVDPAVAREFADTYPEPETLYAIADLGGWDAVNAELFDEEDGAIARIYDEATS